ncbi:efflux RND transporter periplasmic adaptor subunit [Streptococcus pantholopis]|uniref:Efflux transporter periplasmic adaptor subunit n=1 Tax=Streptococcus pantholopis TaxID=1811193 RepID=A0A172Q5X8_9STRE|nr:efflux RND transporter periplasmic adaptor subunit [Streptococcus pantholopis]AND78883.1 efflux transporter periplasmic adaptor subunit [Streptococcus pantholopis]
MAKKRSSKKLSKRTKGIIWGAAAACVLIIGLILYLQQASSQSNSVSKEYSLVNAAEGSVNSTTLLSGTVKATSEQYVYFDSSKGTQATVNVSVGDQVTAGQQLVQYDATAAQAAYDSAVRSANKIARQIEYLKTYGNLPTTESSVDEETGEATTTTVPPTQQATASYNQQLQDLNDSYADAQSEIAKAQEALNQTIITSDVTGTVVEVNHDVDPSSKESQTLVHVVTEGQLRIEGTLTEYDLANISNGQQVKITSKVYPDQEWTGTISHISNYPKEGNAGNTANAASGSSGSSGSSSGASYEYRADITSPLNELKQGFTVSVEVVNDTKHILVPLMAIVNEGKKNYVWVYDDSSSKIKKAEVSLGSADAKSQEITGGLELGQIIIENPDKDFQDGQKIENTVSGDTDSAKDK